MKVFEHLDLNVIEHCNNRCVSCNHASPFALPWFANPETVKRDLESLKKVCRVGFIAVLGGEPLLHNLLPEIIEVCSESGLSKTIKLVTNGWLLPYTTEELWKTLSGHIVEFVAYPNLDAKKEAEIDRHCKPLAKKFNVHYCKLRQPKFCFAFHKPDDGRTFFACGLKGLCVTVHDGRFYLCAQSAFFPQRVMARERGIDGLDLTEINEEKFDAFINRKTPLISCTICASLGDVHVHKQATTEAQWIAESTMP